MRRPVIVNSKNSILMMTMVNVFFFLCVFCLNTMCMNLYSCRL